MDTRPCTAAGCTIIETSNFELLESPVGSLNFSNHCSGTRAQKACAMLKRQSRDSHHFSYYLMISVCNIGQVNYLCRTTLKELCDTALHDFDKTMRATFSTCSALSLSGQ